MKRDTTGLLAVLAIGLGGLLLLNSTDGSANGPPEVTVDVTGLRQYIEIGPDPVDLEIAEKLATYGKVLDGVNI